MNLSSLGNHVHTIATQFIALLSEEWRNKNCIFSFIYKSDLPRSSQNSKYVGDCSDVDNHFKTFEVWFPKNEQVKGFSGDDDEIFVLFVSQLPELPIIKNIDYQHVHHQTNISTVGVLKCFLKKSFDIKSEHFFCIPIWIRRLQLHISFFLFLFGNPELPTLCPRLATCWQRKTNNNIIIWVI